jgi:hypothetical protein
VVIPERRAASVTAAACKASAGAVEHLPVARVRNLADWLAEAKRRGAWIYGASAEAQRPYTEAEWSGRAVLVLGAEGSGLRPRVAKACDELISIPISENVVDNLFELVSRYESATVADLYELVGLNSTHTDHKWGWTDLHGAGVTRIRGGYLLDLPEPEPLD